MGAYSTFRVLFLLPAMGNIFFENSVTGELTSLTSCPPTLDSLPTLEVPQIKPELFPKSTVKPCPGYEKDFTSSDFINEIANSRILKLSLQKPKEDITPCEEITQPIADRLDKCTKCDLSFVVLILSKKDGKMTVTGQGIRLRDCSIYTIYTVTQLGEGLWVKYPDGSVKEVICMKKLKRCSKNFASEYIYTIQLVVEQGCCEDNCFAEPAIQTYTGALPIPGYSIVPANSTSTDYCLASVIGVFVPDPTVTALSIVFPHVPHKIIIGAQGGVFITQDCKVLGIFVTKPVVVVGVRYSVPLVQQVSTSCVLLYIPVEL